MKKFILFVFVTLLLIFTAKISTAAETMIFDSTDNYLGGCQLTNKSEWELKEDLDVAKFQLWYNWDAGETSVPVTVNKDGDEFAKFDVTRSQCDPYQKQWCNGDYIINKLFSKGKYTTEIPKTKQCLKPGGTGTVRLYNGGEIQKVEPTLTTTEIPVDENPELHPT